MAKAIVTNKTKVVDNKVYMTAEGLKDLKTEHEHLINIRRKEVAERIKTAREFGDISENAEYESARDEQAFVEGRIAELEEVLNNVAVMSTKVCDDKIGLGCKVRLHIDGKEEEFQIVSAPEADPSAKKISHESPLGQALIGKKAGDKVAIHAPVGDLTYTILAVK